MKVKVTQCSAHLIIKMTVNVMLQFRSHVVFVRIENVLATIHTSKHTNYQLQPPYVTKAGKKLFLGKKVLRF